MSTKPTAAVLRLKLAFATLPMKGLLFWEALLFFKDDAYSKLIEEKFAAVVTSLSQEAKEAKAYYRQILDDLNETRKKVSKNCQVRDEVMELRDAIIARLAYETAIFDMYNANLKNANKEMK